MYKSDKKEYYKPIRTGNTFSNSYIEYESNRYKDKTFYYIDMIRQYLSEMINDHKTQSEWKIQLRLKINFISSKYSNEIRTMLTKSDNIEIMISNKTDKIIKKLFESLLQKYQNELKKSMKGSEFVFISADLLYYKHSISLNRGGRTYILHNG